MNDTPALDARLLLESATGLDQSQQIMQSNCELSEAELKQLSDLLGQRLAHKPMAYILGTKEFYGRSFFVDSRVLIPRPDTETLIEAVLRFASSKRKEEREPMVDVCTGSGCIGITLSLELDIGVTLSDIDDGALEVASKNALALLGDRFNLLKGNLLSPTDQKYGIIVSNPPYLTRTWCEEVSEEVAWEPRLALDGFGPDGLDLIRVLIGQSKSRLKDGGALFLECDYRQTRDVAQMFADCGFTSVAIETDLAGKERVVWGILHV